MRLAWPAVRVLARVELRRRWRGLVAVGLLAGVAGAAVTGTVGMAHRSATAHERLERATGVDDARVLLFGGALAPADVAALPEVTAAWVATSVVGRLAGPQVAYVGVSSGSPPPPGLFTPVVVDGRAPRPGDPQEVLLSEPMAAMARLGVGDTLDLRLLTPAEVAQFDVGFGDPDGPAVRLRVTGVARLPSWGGGLGHVVATPAFAARYADSAAGSTVLLRLRPDVGPADLTAALDRLAADAPVLAGAEEFGAYQLDLPATRDDAVVATTERVLVGGLGVSAAVAAAAGLLALGQALARHHAGSAADQRVEAALGLTRAERTLARVLPAGLAAGVAVVVVGGGGLAAGWLQPLGALARFEPDPGWSPDLPVVTAGALLTGVAVLLVAAGTAARAGAAGGGAPATVPSLVTRWARRAPLLVGATFALTPGGRRSVPVRATLAGAVVGVAGVVAVGTFAASLDRLAGDPAAYGWTADLSIVDAQDADVDRVAADPRTAGLALVEEGRIRTAAGATVAWSVVRTAGHLPWTTLEGRLPARAGEVALGPRLAERLDVVVGERLRLAGPDGARRDLTVVGVVLTPVADVEPLGSTAVLAPADLAALTAAQPFRTALVRGTDGPAAAALLAELATDLEVRAAEPPLEVRNLTDLGTLPVALAAFLAALAAAMLLHALVLTARRRARDIAVVQALGATPRQVAGSLLVMSATTAAVGLAVGVPLGLGLGRLVWAEVAAASGLAAGVHVPPGPLLLLLAAVAAGAVAVAVVPAWRAAALRPAPLLRTE